MSTSAATAAAADAPATASRARTGGPKDDRNLLEHLVGWTLVVVLAMLFTQTGLM
ncbi:SCO1431 family membrane protein [Streptomyces sp. CB02923]|uniref:SCO1431 family membrane protein n=1 Tax=Streptomyces sp. CB02923 TaxID=1718985 RepID=UPI0019027429|nr:SCO1431 family membrane protein [Streptomyces sp. CB02923]